MKRIRFDNRSRILLHLALLMMCCTGCGSPTGSICGHVTLNDKVISTGIVSIHTESGETYFGPICEDGSYRVERIPFGKVRVAISGLDRRPDGFRVNLPLPESNMGPLIAPKPESHVAQDPVPPRFGDPDLSGMSCKVDQAEVSYDLKIVASLKKMKKSSPVR